MFLDELKKEQTEGYFQIVCFRWKAIQKYYMGDIKRSVEELEAALHLAKEMDQPSWMIKDILIDLRNLNNILCMIRNEYTESEVQKELSQSDEEVYYPLMDRLHNSLHEKYMEGLKKEKIQSPYSVNLGHNFAGYAELLVSGLVIAMYNGSLTHILLFYEEMQEFLFYLCCKFDNLSFRFDMLKLTIYSGKEKEVKNILDSYPEILNNMDAKRAAEIMDFCGNQPIEYKRFISQLIAFGTVGYYLDDNKFRYWSTFILNGIQNWMNSPEITVAVGGYIFSTLTNVYKRLEQETLSEICCSFFEKHYRQWYSELFKFIGQCIDLNEMEEDSAKKLIQNLLSVFDSSNDREEINYARRFLIRLRKQNRQLTQALDEKIFEYMPNFYNNVYLLETTEKEEDLHQFVSEYVQRIRHNNATQGEKGVYTGRSIREIDTVRNILLRSETPFKDAIIDSIVLAASETVLHSKEDITTKIDAVRLLIFLVVKYPKTYDRNNNIYDDLLRNYEKIEAFSGHFALTNISEISLKIGLNLLYTAMGKDVYIELLELMPYIQNDTATTISVTKTIVDYLEISESVVYPPKIESIILQNTIQWIHSDYLDVRWNAVRILFFLLRNPENEGIINHQLINLVDSDNVYIKNLIMRNILHTQGISEASKQYIMKKCHEDPNYVVRFVCQDLRNKEHIPNDIEI